MNKSGCAGGPASLARPSPIVEGDNDASSDPIHALACCAGPGRFWPGRDRGAGRLRGRQRQFDTQWHGAESSASGMVDVVIVPPTPTSGTGYATHIVLDVPVAASGTTSIGTLTTLAASTINTASGTVTVSGSPGAANLVADQTVSSAARTYEIASTATTTGPYSVPLAASGPWLATYSTTLPITFTQDTATTDAGIYSITATDAAGTFSTQSVNVSTGSVFLNFMLTP
jgi:hypothetical protein